MAAQCIIRSTVTIILHLKKKNDKRFPQILIYDTYNTNNTIKENDQHEYSYSNVLVPCNQYSFRTNTRIGLQVSVHTDRSVYSQTTVSVQASVSVQIYLLTIQTKHSTLIYSYKSKASPGFS